MLLFQTSREIIFYFQHFIQVCFYFLGTGPPGPSPCYGTGLPVPRFNTIYAKDSLAYRGSILWNTVSFNKHGVSQLK